MIYAADIQIPKNTTVAAPQRTVLKVTRGLVYKVEIDFPPGPWGLVGIALFDGSFQIYPTSPGTFFHTDNRLISYDDVYLKQTEPFEFAIIGYNTDDTYGHTVNVRLGMVSQTIFMARFLPHLSYEFFKEMLLELQRAQEEERASQLESPFPWLKG